MVCYIDGKPAPKEFRKYHIKTVEGPNDYASMKEVIYRRYFRLLMEEEKMPDLILMDGGMIQVNAAKEVLESLGLDINVAGMQKNEVQYFTSDMAKIGATCYLEIDGVTRIIGTILFEDGTTGYLTDNNYLDEDRYDSYGGDRIILIEKENRIKTEKGDVAFVSKTDFDNYKGNFKIERLTKSIDIYKKSIDCSTRIIELCESIISQKESLTFEQMFDMRNGKVC
jgi:hypothetical protein